MSDSQCPIQINESDTFANRLRSLIEGESIAGFARHVGVPEANIHTYLRGMTPQMDKLIRIATACGITVEWLATGRGIRSAAAMRKAEKSQHNAPPVLHVTHNEPALTPQEHAVLELFRALDPDAQREIQHAAEEKKRLRDIEQQLDELRTFLNQKA